MNENISKENKNFQKEKTYKVCVYRELNVRKYPTYEASVIGKLNNNSIVKSFIEKGEWVQIKYNGVYGWVNKNYLLEV